MSTLLLRENVLILSLRSDSLISRMAGNLTLSNRRDSHSSSRYVSSQVQACKLVLGVGRLLH